MRLLIAFLLGSAATATVQNCECDWTVVGIGGGDMPGGNCKCGSTVGQIAVGPITGANCWSLIGFRQPQPGTGVGERAYSRGRGPLVTHLCFQFPARAVRSVRWNGTDDRSRSLANGVCFVKSSAGGRCQTSKVVVRR